MVLLHNWLARTFLTSTTENRILLSALRVQACNTNDDRGCYVVAQLDQTQHLTSLPSQREIWWTENDE
jgi:hypothetical protein